jgi:hypothetical protein
MTWKKGSKPLMATDLQNLTPVLTPIGICKTNKGSKISDTHHLKRRITDTIETPDLRSGVARIGTSGHVQST